MAGSGLINVSEFNIDKYEVTFVLWNQVRNWAIKNGYEIGSGDGFGANHPIHSVNWFDAVKWCNARSEMSGLSPAYYLDEGVSLVYRTGVYSPVCIFGNGGYRLPTEAEWEKAARGGVANQSFPWGSDSISVTNANYNDSGFNGTVAVGAYLANTYGIHDIAGNVLEWCWNWYGPQADLGSNDPKGPDIGQYRMMRGGGWRSIGRYCEIANRDNIVNPANAYRSVGFRTVRSIRTHQFSGTVEYYLNSQGVVSGVTLNMGGAATRSVVTAADGSYTLQVPESGSVTVTPNYGTDVPIANGVTTADITLIRRHVLGLALLDLPYKVLAGDVNGSDSVTTADITLIRRLILGTATNFSGGLWRFVPSDEGFTDATKPWTASRMRQYASLASGTLSGQDFKAIKLGDVNGSWKAPTVSANVMAKSKPKGRLSAGKCVAATGDVIGLPILGEGFAGVTSMQFTIRWNPTQLEFVSVGTFKLPGLTAGNFNSMKAADGVLTFSWDPQTGQGIEWVSLAEMFRVQMKVLAAGGVTAEVSLSESPTPTEVTVDFSPVETERMNGGVTVTGGVVVTLESLVLRVLGINADGRVEVSVQGPVGVALAVETTSDLSTWAETQRVTGQGASTPVNLILQPDPNVEAKFLRLRVR